MNNQKPYKTVDINQETKRFQDSLVTVNDYMSALAIDYYAYFSTKRDRRIYSHRDNILYRLRAMELHSNILLNLLNSTNETLTAIYFQPQGAIEAHHHYRTAIHNINSLLDSVIFHLSSAFDYLSNLIFYISLKEDTNSKWSNVAKAVRQGKLKGLTFSSLIDDLDRTFVNQLYGYRSQVIHYKEDCIGSSLSVEFDQENVYAKFSSSTKFNQNFKELRELQKDFDLSISYVLMWLLNINNRFYYSYSA